MLSIAKVLGAASLTMMVMVSTTPSVALAASGNSLNARAHGHRQRDHAQLARAFKQNGTAQPAKKRSSPARRNINGTKVIKRSDGSYCKVRPTDSVSSGAASATASATSSDYTYVEAATTAASSSSSSSAADWTPSAVSSSAAAVETAATSSTEDVYSSSESVAASATSVAVAAVWAASDSEATTSSSAAAVTTTAASTSSSSSGSSTSGTNAGSKFGLAWPNGDWATSSSNNYIGNWVGSKSSWYYTWSPYNVGSGDNLGLEFVPMLWGPAQEGVWWTEVANWPSTVKNVLFYNEPNEASQCNVAAADAVASWRTNMQPLKEKGYSLGLAATTSAPSGLQWIKDFISACPDCTFDFIPIHYYDVDVSNFKAYVENFHTQTGADIWITEYACQNFNGGSQCDEATTWSFHQEMAAWFDEQDYVKRYAPFGAMENMQGVEVYNALMSTSGDITALGSWYVNSS